MVLLAERNLPVTPVHDLEEASDAPALRASGWFEQTPVPGGGRLPMAAPFVRSVSATPDRPAPRLGEHSDSLAREFDLQ